MLCALSVSDKKWLREEEADQTRLLLFVCDNKVKGLESKLTETQHDHASMVSLTMHINVSKRDCLEAIVVNGKASEIRKLSNELTRKKSPKS